MLTVDNAIKWSDVSLLGHAVDQHADGKHYTVKYNQAKHKYITRRHFSDTTQITTNTTTTFVSLLNWINQAINRLLRYAKRPSMHIKHVHKIHRTILKLNVKCVHSKELPNWQFCNLDQLQYGIHITRGDQKVMRLDYKKYSQWCKLPSIVLHVHRWVWCICVTFLLNCYVMLWNELVLGAVMSRSNCKDT